MVIEYVSATPDLKRVWKEQSPSNASDFICFNEDYHSVIAMVDGRPAGLIVAKKRRLAEPLQMVEEAFVDIIEVQPEYQRRGIGTALMANVLAWAQDNHLAQIRAWSEEVRREALLLWNKLGFTFSQVDFQRGDEKRYGFYVAKRI
jgi:GNAT superfamily N-acetyltransferase